MRIERSNFHILTGGPGAGKTTVLEALRARGYSCTDEAARRILKEQAASGGNATHDGDRVRYRDLMLEQGVRDFHAVGQTSSPVFFDRGIPELSGYPSGAEDPPTLTAAIAECRYNQTVFLFPPWEAIYRHDEERKHTFEHAVAVDALIREVYPKFGYDIADVPRALVEERVQFILGRVAK